MKIKVSVGNSRMDKKWRLAEMELEEIRDRIFQTKVTAESVAEFRKMPKAQQDAIKDIGGFVLGTLKGGRRKKDCVVSRSALSLDMDYAAQEVIEQVEEAIHREFPGARVLRMDADTTRRKDSYERILSAFADEEADILVGTQMIVKGHDFPGVTLVGVLAADLSLNRNDYRAGERTFQLLTQAAGRAGRREQPGEVVIQTYQPEHYSVVYATRQDYRGFYGEEIAYRGLVGYPPVEHMLAVLIVSRVQEDGEKLGEEMTDLVKREMADAAGLRVIGPAEAAIGKISDLFRHTFYIRHGVYQTLVEAKDRLENFCRERELKGQTVQFDFDPMNTF